MFLCVPDFLQQLKLRKKRSQPLEPKSISAASATVTASAASADYISGQNRSNSRAGESVPFASASSSSTSDSVELNLPSRHSSHEIASALNNHADDQHLDARDCYFYNSGRFGCKPKYQSPCTYRHCFRALGAQENCQGFVETFRCPNPQTCNLRHPWKKESRPPHHRSSNERSNRDDDRDRSRGRERDRDDRHRERDQDERDRDRDRYSRK